MINIFKSEKKQEILQLVTKGGLKDSLSVYFNNYFKYFILKRKKCTKIFLQFSSL